MSVISFLFVVDRRVDRIDKAFVGREVQCPVALQDFRVQGRVEFSRRTVPPSRVPLRSRLRF